ncbi:hypothetical protein COP2_035666 [Malus domestica]
MLEEMEGWVEGAEGSDVGVQEVEGGNGRAEGGSREEWTTKGGGVREGGRRWDFWDGRRGWARVATTGFLGRMIGDGKRWDGGAMGR